MLVTKSFICFYFIFTIWGMNQKYFFGNLSCLCWKHMGFFFVTYCMLCFSCWFVGVPFRLLNYLLNSLIYRLHPLLRWPLLQNHLTQNFHFRNKVIDTGYEWHLYFVYISHLPLNPSLAFNSVYPKDSFPAWLCRMSLFWAVCLWPC